MKFFQSIRKGKFSAFVLSIVMIIMSVFPITAYAEENNGLENNGVQTKSVDQMLLKSQKWLNDNYSSKSDFGSVPEDGVSRRSTVNGCIRALQIELGITQTANNFGSGTIKQFNIHYPNGIVQQEYPSSTENNIYGILQCALWVKGYYIPSSSITKHFYDGTGDAVKELKSDMGFSNPDSTVTLNVMKGLLSMDQYTILSGGNDSIRAIQQRLNRDYENYIGIIPCDGICSRQMNKAMIKVLQAIEGYSPDDATGNFGSGTKSKLPLLPDTNNLLDESTEKKAIVLLKYALCCNGYDIGFSEDFDTTLYNTLIEFQKNMALSENGKADVDTWMSLLLSKGNPDRSSIACDTRFEMTQERIDYLKANGYKIVGRYLTGSEKGLKDDEPARILNNGISFFPIFQETLYTDTISKYNYALGVADARRAISRASELNIPENSVIYFAIDFDPTDGEISTYVKPYFEAIKDNIGIYKVGIYGTRNTCTQMMESGYAETCFVSDMSTGYSGNMGFKMPNNWTLDQFSEYSVTTASGEWDIDKVAYSGKFPVVSALGNPHKYVAADSDAYFLGEVTLSGRNSGNWFTAYGSKIRYRVIWESLDGEDITNYLSTDIEEYGKAIIDTMYYQYGKYDYETEFKDIDSGVDYRLNYSAYNGAAGVPLNVKAKVYIYTQS